jgi:YegS/Rv2252/BmrU family lipid kinase
VPPVNVYFPRQRVEVLLNVAAGVFQREEINALREGLAASFDAEALGATADYLSPEDIERTARRALDRARRQEIDAVIVGGGDGTIHTVANVLAGTNVPLGILPLGTFNHFARDLGIPLAIEQAIQVIAARHTVAVDVGEVNGRIFINNSSVGIYPYIVIDRERARRDGNLDKRAALLRSAWRVLRRFPVHRLLVHAEGRGAPFKTPIIFIGNNSYSLSLPAMGRRQRIDEGHLSIYVAKTQSRLSLLWLACRALLGLLDVSQDLETFQETAAEIRARRRRLAVALDGEVEIMATPLKYRIRPQALRVFAPAPQGA